MTTRNTERPEPPAEERRWAVEHLVAALNVDDSKEVAYHVRQSIQCLVLHDERDAASA